MKRHSMLVLILLALAGCQDLPIPRVVASPSAAVPNQSNDGVLVARVIGLLSVLPLGFSFPFNSRGLDLVVTDASGRQLLNQGRAVTEGSTFLDSLIDVPAAANLTLTVTLTDVNGAVLATGQAGGISITSGQFTNVTVLLQAAALGR